ncbi:uncharacterized protein HMPREF1541_02196 [Cyphellophora europaea CBS 101466]|uniref:Piwi domain-containing protein n=1 Tax=Cyphellophora europaea (strain CBS 101466) TaxID=1220924 RepID=W2S4R7_CYPE1|nr:uncharacterized protein HMPREF1541_02196 [Cyphellophora europaea CBS 101466]ETN43038.1 hypothetical protein HMPREF1541_02196 [Cyphellophora europaea CBS 101466]
MEERFHCWLRHNQVLPTQSIVYRDGLFEGQFNQSVAEEIPQFKRAVDNVYVDRARPSLQVVCVVNRHHQRFYPGKENTTPNGNVLPGICVDLSVRGGQRLDTRTVFASPTTPSRKTARPVPHVLLHDEPACDIKELQLMAPDPPPQKADASAEQAPADLINIFECKFTPTRTITDVEKKRKTGKKTHHPSMTNPDSDIGTPTSEASPTKPKRRLVFLMKALETRQDMKGINLASDYNQHLYTLTALPLTLSKTLSIRDLVDYERENVVDKTESGAFIPTKNATLNALNAILTNAAVRLTFADLNPGNGQSERQQVVVRADSKKYYHTSDTTPVFDPSVD